MKTIIISTKEIRNDLEGFLRKLRHGQTIQVMYRSKPLVTLAAQEAKDPYLAEDAGTQVAAIRSISYAKQLGKRKPTFDPQKSFKELYDDTKSL